MAFAHAPLPSVDAGCSRAGGPRGGSVCPPDDEGRRGDFQDHAPQEREPAVIDNVVRLKRRSEFLAVAATGRRWTAPAFVLQAGPRPVLDGTGANEIGLGFTATKRLGNAVARNRAKRRLRAAASQILPDAATAGHDYVIIARAGVLTCAFQTLLDDLEKAFSRVLTVQLGPFGASRRKAGSRPPAPPSPPGASAR